MDKIGELTGRDYKPFDYYGAPDAEQVIVAMGSVCETAEETIDCLNAEGQESRIVIKVRLYRPFSAEHLPSVHPEDQRKRLRYWTERKKPGASGEPLYLDVKSAFYETEKTHR